MKVAQVTLPLAALLMVGTASAIAGPQSMLDPYANIKAPAHAPAPPKRKARPYESPSVSNPGSEMNAAPVKAEKAADENGGFLAGTKQILHGMGTATKGAASDVVHPVKSLGGGIAAGAKKVGGGVKAAGDRVKDGTAAAGKAISVVPKKMGEGLKATGDRIKEGSEATGHALAKVPHAVGKGMKKTGEKVAGGTEAVGNKVKDGTSNLGGKIVAVPKAVGKGIGSAAVKTGEGAKKVAMAPFKLAGRLNPFHRGGKDKVETAASSATAK